MQPRDFFLGTRERVRNSRGKRAISVRATEVRLYLFLKTLIRLPHFLSGYFIDLAVIYDTFSITTWVPTGNTHIPQATREYEKYTYRALCMPSNLK